VGPMGKDEKVMWDVPRGCNEICVFSFLQPVLLQDTLPSPHPSPRAWRPSRQVSIPQLPAWRVTPHCIPTLILPQKTLFPYKTGQRKRGWGQYFHSVLVFQNGLPWLFVEIHPSDWCKIPYSLCFFRTYSSVDFVP